MRVQNWQGYETHADVKRVSSNYARSEKGYETHAVTMRVRNKDMKLTQ